MYKIVMKRIKIEHYLLQTGITSRGSARCWSFSWLAKKKMTSCSKLVKALLSVWEIVLCSSLVQKPSRSLQASLAKSRSRTSGEATETIANASLSSLIVAQPTWKENHDAQWLKLKKKCLIFKNISIKIQF